MEHRSIVAKVSAAIALVTLSGTFAQAQTSSFGEATCTVPSDPSRIVLFVTTSSMDMTRQSLTLHADGRLFLQEKNGPHELLSVEAKIAYEAVSAVLVNAAQHGLMEWDDATIRAEQSRKLGGRTYPDPADGLGVTIQLSADDYQRGDLRVPVVDKTITVTEPRIAARHFPEIPHFKGIMNLLAWMQTQFAAAKASHQ